MSMKIALAGNPNCGKTTLFNDLTGQTQYVGNWPGVTVEKKEGRLKGQADVIIQDLPGIYSLSPYTLEEVVSRNYLTQEKPDAILNIVDGSNLERNLYLTTQLLELGTPVVIALNMIDIVRKNGDKIDVKKLGQSLGCEVIEMSALKGEGVKAAASRAVELAASRARPTPPSVFGGTVEHAIAHIEDILEGKAPADQVRFYAIKLFERDEKIAAQLTLAGGVMSDVEKVISECEAELDDDAESIITNERYAYISRVIATCLVKKRKPGSMSTSDKIDRVVTSRLLALPIFAVVIILMYYVSVSWLGAIGTDWANDGVFGDGWHLLAIGDAEYQAAVADFEAAVIAEEPDPADYGVWVPGVPVLVEHGLDALGTADWLKSLIVDGIVGGVGAVLGFVPQMLILFLMLAFLEDCGYMARIAFIMDRVFRRFGLSGKSFIPMLIGTGCGVPGIMASRTIEQDRDRKMTIMTTTFIPCGAKLPIIALIAGAVFGGAWWVSPSAYFLGIGAIVVSGIMLKKTRMFAGDPAPFVMELPAYHWPTLGNVLRSMWERGWSFIKKAGTIILLASIGVWFCVSFGWADGAFGMVEDMELSIMAHIGNFVAPVFAPLGFGNWQSSVATVLGLVAKEEVVGVFGTLYAVAGDALELVEAGAFGELGAIAMHFSQLSAYSFLVFNLLCAPCFAAIGAIRREMNNAKWTWFAIGYQTAFAYAIALIIYQIGGLFAGNGFGAWTVVALACIAVIAYLLARPGYAAKGDLRAVSA